MAAAIAPRLETPLAQSVDSRLVEQGRRLRDDDILLDVSVASDDRPQDHFAVDAVGTTSKLPASGRRSHLRFSPRPDVPIM